MDERQLKNGIQELATLLLEYGLYTHSGHSCDYKRCRGCLQQMVIPHGQLATFKPTDFIHGEDCEIQKAKNWLAELEKGE